MQGNGVKCLQNNTVLITGAGFSSPADLPIQEKILSEMEQSAESGFLESESFDGSVKFYIAYIKVSIYLIKEYGNSDITELEMAFNQLLGDYYNNKRASEIIGYTENILRKETEKLDFSINPAINMIADKFIIDQDRLIYGLLKIKEQIRHKLIESHIRIILEDVFTAFDKSISRRENSSNYTYSQMDDMQHSLLRLFVYYFSKKVNNHNLDNSDYMAVMDFLKANESRISVITTNWDVLLEKYMSKTDIRYDYSFNSSYVIGENGRLFDASNRADDGIKLVKIHGSINWFRCLKCGSLQVYDTKDCGLFLFQDNEPERCLRCGQEVYGEDVLLRPEIITPTLLKSIDGVIFSNLWQNAAYELQKADRVIFCGYSLPIADFEFRQLLKQNIKKEAQIDVVLHRNDNPKNYLKQEVELLLPERRYRDLFANNKCSFYYDGFGVFFKSRIS